MATMIKFRAWDKVKKVMMVPRDMQTDSDGNIFYVEAMGPDGEYDEGDLDVFKFEQFTGLKDVNGNDIYVGDILKTKAGLIQIVDQGILAIDREDIISGFYANNLSDDKPHTFSYDDEIIGNVHENPELLEADK